VTRRRIERALAYVLLVIIAIVGITPFVIIAILSTKARIDILQVPPTLDFDLDQIVENYRTVLIRQGFLGFIWNSIVVTSATVALSLVLATPAAYA
jgi:ABC-type glycerol-3-phosphate transport system permease component